MNDGLPLEADLWWDKMAAHTEGMPWRPTGEGECKCRERLTVRERTARARGKEKGRRE